MIMKTEEKSSPLPRVRLAILGQTNVGKSALTVRYLTRRYIGEYRSDTDLLYKQTVNVNNGAIDVEIVDVSGESNERPLPVEQVEWSDACVLVYSITDRKSFRYAQQALHRVADVARPTALLGNKADLDHLRQVAEPEGRQAAAERGCQFYEVSAAEDSAALYQAFDALLGECRAAQQQQQQAPKARKFSVSKMLGTLMGKPQPPPLAVGAGKLLEFHGADAEVATSRQRRLSGRLNLVVAASS